MTNPYVIVAIIVAMALIACMVTATVNTFRQVREENKEPVFVVKRRYQPDDAVEAVTEFVAASRSEQAVHDEIARLADNDLKTNYFHKGDEIQLDIETTPTFKLVYHTKGTAWVQFVEYEIIQVPSV